MLTNWIQDENKFALAGPPKWFQMKLWEFDNSLVIVPSRQGFYYRLAQRRKLQLPEHIVNEALWKYSDTQMLARYSLVPVTTILATVNWGNPYIFEELRRRAPWRMGGAEKVNADLDAQDQKIELNKQAKTDAHLSSLGKDGWNLYNKKIGVRSHMYIPKVRRTAPAKEPKAPGLVLGQR